MQATDIGTSHSNKYFTDITTSLSEKVSSHMSMKGTKVPNLAVVSKLFINSMPA